MPSTPATSLLRLLRLLLTVSCLAAAPAAPPPSSLAFRCCLPHLWSANYVFVGPNGYKMGAGRMVVDYKRRLFLTAETPGTGHGWRMEGGDGHVLRYFSPETLQRGLTFAEANPAAVELNRCLLGGRLTPDRRGFEFLVRNAGPGAATRLCLPATRKESTLRVVTDLACRPQSFNVTMRVSEGSDTIVLVPPTYHLSNFTAHETGQLSTADGRLLEAAAASVDVGRRECHERGQGAYAKLLKLMSPYRSPRG